jgi:5-methylcytosine-specific restriction endonuclease McrA
MNKFNLDFLDSYDDQAILLELRRIAQVKGTNLVTKKDIDHIGRCSYHTVIARFGTLRAALQKAGLKFQRFNKSSETELLSILVDLWGKTLQAEGRRPERTDLKRFGYPVSSDTVVRRFKSWKKALKLAYDSVNTESVDPANPIEAPATLTRERKALSIHKRFLVMKRDHFACRICGASGHGIKLEVDHIVPVAREGTDAMDNLQTLCYSCNRGKRADLM